jgi:hypothetical protein
MVTNLPKYYRIASIEQLPEATLERRSEAIMHMTTMDLTWLLDCIRIYLDKPLKNSSFIVEMNEIIRKFDSVYIGDDNQLEKRIIAGAVIHECLTERSDCDLIAAALKSGSFGLASDKLINTEIIDDAIAQLNDSSIQQRELNSTPEKAAAKLPALARDPAPTLEALTETVRLFLVYAKSIAAIYDEKITIQDRRILVLEEESNIHWWLFRSTSVTTNAAVAKLPSAEAVYILASELYELVRLVPLPPNTKSFLSKIWSEVKDKTNELSIKEATETYNTKLSTTLPVTETIYDSFGNLAPLHQAIAKCKESNGAAAWTTLFDMNGLQSDFKASTSELSFQFMNELSLHDLT